MAGAGGGHRRVGGGSGSVLAGCAVRSYGRERRGRSRCSALDQTSRIARHVRVDAALVASDTPGNRSAGKAGGASMSKSKIHPPADHEIAQLQQRIYLHRIGLSLSIEATKQALRERLASRSVLVGAGATGFILGLLTKRRHASTVH